MSNLILCVLIVLKSIQAFYLPNAGRENLKVLTYASVNKILTKTTQEGNLVATGVEFVHGERTFVINVTMEVILCAGYVATVPFFFGWDMWFIYLQSPEVTSDPRAIWHRQQHLTGVGRCECTSEPLYRRRKPSRTYDDSSQLRSA